MITWTGLVRLLLEAKGRMPQAKWAALRDEAQRRRARWNTDYSDIIEALI